MFPQFSGGSLIQRIVFLKQYKQHFVLSFSKPLVVNLSIFSMLSKSKNKIIISKSVTMKHLGKQTREALKFTFVEGFAL